MDKTDKDTQDMCGTVSIGDASLSALSSASQDVVSQDVDLREDTRQASRTRKLPEKMEERKWKPGQSGNPKGRPKGARTKLANAFAADLLEDWNERGMEAVQACREQRPQDYLKVIASIMPKDFNVNMRPLEDLNDEQLRENIKRTLDELGQAGAVILGGIAQGSTNKEAKSKA